MTSKAVPAYRMSFSTGRLFRNESVAITELHGRLGDWSATTTLALSSGVLPFRSQSSAKRTVREIVHRLRALTHDERDLLVNGDRNEQDLLLWLALCRTYPFIAEFAGDLLNERFLSFRTDLGYDDFDVFYASRAEWRPELADINPSTRAKLRQVLFRMMREAGVLSHRDTILAAQLSPRLRALIAEHGAGELRYFPGADSGQTVSP